MCRIYNRLRAAIDTDYVWVLEDNIVPPDDALKRLMKHFGRDVACVGAPYPSRWDPKYVVWSADRKPGQKGVHRAVKPPAGETQLQTVRGMGFGCTVFRSEVLLDHIFHMPRGEQPTLVIVEQQSLFFELLQQSLDLSVLELNDLLLSLVRQAAEGSKHQMPWLEQKRHVRRRNRPVSGGDG
jgi:hypothetical protein